MKYGARNQIEGKVTSIKKGTIMGEAMVEIESSALMSSVMTLDSMNDLDLKEGDSVKVIVKAVNVLLVKE